MSSPMLNPINGLLLLFLLGFPLSSSALSFNFTAFAGDDTNITYESAFPADNAIQLTRNLLGTNLSASVGRATYTSLLPLWDPISRNLTDFRTHFTFSIFSQFIDGYGDGFAFFFSTPDSRLPASAGGTLGLTSGPDAVNSSANRFVAVEFDIFSNDFDPTAPLGRHVGIDINSLRSVRTIPWGGDVMGGRMSEAWISYDSGTRNLSVAVSGFVRDFGVVQRLSYIVDFRDYLPPQVRFGFSGSTGQRVAIHRIHSWDFASTLEAAVEGNRTADGGRIENRGKKSRVALLSGLVAGGIVLGLLICFGIVFRKRIYGFLGKGEREDGFQMNELFETGRGGAGPIKFSFKQLARATNNFNERSNKLGEGGFGKVYKGNLKDKNDGKFVAVKRVSRKSSQGMKEFIAEVKIISRLRHRNLVQLIGWCNERKELLLVYEFLPNGSLDSHLFNRNENTLNWETRYRIAKGLATGLLYLHEEWEQCVVHRDIKSSNVMLDSNFNPKLGDFGLARLVDHEKGSQTTLLAGTMGYLAPECAITGKASRESDVYSLGVVLLEIATAKRPGVKVKETVPMHLVEWVWNLYGEGRLMMECPDRNLDGDFDGDEMERIMMVGLCCSHPDPSCRPTVRQAVQLLNFEAALPALPLNMPVASYGHGDGGEVRERRRISGEFDESSDAVDASGSPPFTKSSSAITF